MAVIGYVLAAFPVFSETFVGAEMRAMEARGHRVVPILLRPWSGPAQEIDLPLAQRTEPLSAIAPAAAARRLLTPAGIARALPFLAAQRRLPRRSLLWCGAKAAAIAARAGCVHLHAHFAGGAAAHAIVAARLIGAPVSFTAHAHDVYAEPEDLPQKLRAADFTVAVCRELADDLRAMAAGARVVEIACGVDPDRFRPRLGPGNGRLLAIGRLVPQKGFDDLIAALARPQAAGCPGVDVVGAGPCGPELQAMAAAMGLGPERIAFIGPRDGAWIAAEGPAYEGLVAPFKRAADGQIDTGPVVVKEAMAMALPVISTRLMGVTAMIEPACGLLAEPGDVDGIARALGAFAALEPKARRAMGAAGRLRARALFSHARQAALLEAEMLGAAA